MGQPLDRPTEVSDDKGSFWKTVPGILTGLAAVIGAVGTIYIATLGQDKRRSEPPAPVGQSTAAVRTKPGMEASHTEWPLVASDTFTSPSSCTWKLGSFSAQFSAQNSHLDTRILEGKYRTEFRGTNAQYIEAPYPAAVDFYAAVDVQLVESKVIRGNPEVSLVFGRAFGKDYSFTVSQHPSGNFFTFGRYDGAVTQPILETKYTSIQLDKLNRIAVLVEAQLIKVFLNSDEVVAYRDPSFAGGAIGLSIGFNGSGSVIVDFDNFVFRRKP
jgi:hypothetical protein